MHRIYGAKAMKLNQTFTSPNQFEVEALVKWFSLEKGYGFVTRGFGYIGPDIFVPKGVVIESGFNNLINGTRIRLIAAHGKNSVVARKIIYAQIKYLPNGDPIKKVLAREIRAG